MINLESVRQFVDRPIGRLEGGCPTSNPRKLENVLSTLVALDIAKSVICFLVLNTPSVTYVVKIGQKRNLSSPSTCSSEADCGVNQSSPWCVPLAYHAARYPTFRRDSPFCRVETNGGRFASSIQSRTVTAIPTASCPKVSSGLVSRDLIFGVHFTKIGVM
jgi:hypothetical protein